MFITGGIMDTQCGLKAFDPGAIRLIVARSFLDGFLFDVEWIYVALKHGLAVRPWPVMVRAEHRSTPIRKFGLLGLSREFLTIMLGILRRRYDSPELQAWIVRRRGEIVRKALGSDESRRVATGTVR